MVFILRVQKSIVKRANGNNESETQATDRNKAIAKTGLMLIASGLLFWGSAEGQPHRGIEPQDRVPAAEQRVLELINAARRARKLPALARNPLIDRQARQHSRSMALRHSGLHHRGFTERVRTVSTILFFRDAAENVARNQGYEDCAQRAVEAWLASGKHRESIEGDFTLTGIGGAVDRQGCFYFTQIFWR